MQPGAATRAGVKIGLGLLLLMIGATDARSTVRLVRPDGTGDYPTIQLALDASASGDSVLLADGVFTGAGNQDLNFRGRAVLLASQSQSADACVLDVQASPSSQHRGILCSSGEGAGTAVEDLTIIHGYAQVGSAVLMLATSPRFRRVVFAANATSASGAVYALNGSPVFEECVWRDNLSPTGSGGAVYLKFGGAPRFARCKFFDNHARFGGAAYLRESVSPTFERCVWVGNQAYTGGALMGALETHPVFIDNTFDGNRGGIGGAIHLGEDADAEITRCELSRNEASRGAGLACRNAAPLLTECRFTDNRASLFGGGVYADSGSAMQLIRCTLVTNDAAWDAGAIGVLDGGVTCDHCTLSGNAASDTLAAGVSARGTFATVALRGTILAFGRAGCAVRCDDGAQVSLAGCDVFGNAGGDYVGCLAGLLGAAGNICADPRFCNQGGREFMLDESSPCAARVEIEFGVIGAWGVGCDLPDDRADVTDASNAAPIRLGPACPNPFRAATVIAYTLPAGAPADARLEILDCAGRCVRTLAGRGAIAWDGRDATGAPVAAGIYQARLRAGAWVASRSLLRIR